MAAQAEMTKGRNQQEAGTEPQSEPKAKSKPSRRVNLTELFDVLDDIWGYLERNESRTRLFGNLSGVHKEEFNSIRKRLASMRELLHGDPTDDRTDQ